MKKLYLSLLFMCALVLQLAQAQTRYLDPVFPNVTVTTNVVYGLNSTVLAFPTIIKQPLIMDVYQPAGDTQTDRPVVLYLHTGNFLPFQSPIDGSLGFNGSCGGTIRDSAAVEFCTRLAKLGYVACAVDYRAGWNPLAPSDVDRRFGIINAAYRGVQDMRTCIRYFRKTVAESGNPWKVDAEKIIVWGQGTGGYLTLTGTALDDYTKIPFASEGKFLWDHDQNTGTPPIPMVVPQINGDINGTSVGILPTTGDTLCFPNHVGYSSEFAMAVNMGGACADSAWVDPGQKPLVSFHVPYDNFAPYAEGIVNVPGTNLQVVKVQGAYIVQRLIEQFNNNGAFDDQYIPTLGGNQLSAFLNTPKLNGNDWTEATPGLYPFVMPIVQQTPVVLPSTTAPWEWSGTVPNNPTCNTNKAAALPYIDTIMQFVTPRACFVLGLQGCIDQIVANKEPLANDIAVTAAPNPASAEIRFTTGDNQPIQSMQIFDMHGRMVRDIRDINNNFFALQRNGLPNGTFVAKMYFKEGVKAVRFVME
jgi:hypothetical protein